MFLKLLPFELSLQIRQIGFMITCAIIFILGFLFTAVLLGLEDGAGGDRIKINGSLLVTTQIAAIGIASIFFGAIYVVSGVMRDTASKSIEVIHATPVSTPDMMLSRFFGVFLATFLSICAGALGMMAGEFMPWIDPEILGSFNILYYLQPIAVFIVINSLVVSAFFTIIAATTRSTMLVYVSAIGLFIAYTIVSSIPTDLAPKLLVSLLDPFGGVGLALDTEKWSVAEQNVKFMPLTGYLGINRLLWLGISLGLFALSFVLSVRGIQKSKNKKLGGASSAQAEVVLYDLKAPLKTSSLLRLWSRFKLEYLSTVKSVAFLILSALFIPIFTLTIFIQFFLTPEPPIATSPNIAGLIFASVLLPLLLITIFFGGEIVWRDKTVQINELLDPTPTRNWPLLAGKWLALYAILLTLIIMGIVIGVIAQLSFGQAPVHLSTFLSSGFISLAPRLIFFATLVMFVQNFMPNRISGMIIGGLLIVFLIAIYPLIPYTHPLMNYGNTPGSGFSEMGGFSNLGTYSPFLIYWTSLSVILAITSIWIWRRGLQTGLLSRLRNARNNMSLANTATASLAAVVFVGMGGYIYHGYNIQNDFMTQKESERFTAQYEKSFGAQFTVKLPKVRDVSVDVDFYPSQLRAEVSGRYEIENTTGAPLSELYMSIALPGDEGVNLLELEGAVQSHDAGDQANFETYGLRRFIFETPLRESERTVLNFDLSHPAPTLGGRKRVRENGTFLNNTDLLPNLGVPENRLTNAAARRRYDLPELPELPERNDAEARTKGFFNPAADYVNFEATVCTDKGQIPLAPGDVINDYEKDGRPCRDYKPREPISFFAAFVSADYEALEDTWTRPNGQQVKLGIFYDRKHNYNVQLMMQAMKDSLDVFTETFGPYQFDTLRIMEFPFGGFAQSFPNTIAFSENIGFVTDPGDKDDNQSLDLATYVTMHEIGHQWFGHQIIPSPVQGFNILSEGLTENAAMTAYEMTYGWQKARRVLERRSIEGQGGYLLGQALEGRNEEPLATARGEQQYMVYAKASWVFWGMKHYLGEEQMQGSVRRFLEDYGRKGPPYPTTLELVEYLREVAGPDYQQLLTDYWDRITFWDLTLDKNKTSLNRNLQGGYTVDLTLELDKTVSSKETGRAVSVTEAEYARPKKVSAADASDIDREETPAFKGGDPSQGELIRPAESLAEWVEIGFYDKDPSKTWGDEWIKLERVRITQMDTKLSFELDTKPTHVLVDPRRLLIERDVSDNDVVLTLNEG